MINWQMITDGLHDAGYKGTEKEMMQKLYDDTGSTKRMEDILGVSRTTIIIRMRKLGIEILEKGWGRKRVSVLHGMDVTGKSAPHIAREIGCHLTAVHSYAQRHKMKLRNMKGRCRGMGRTP